MSGDQESVGSVSEERRRYLSAVSQGHGTCSISGDR